MLFLGKLRYVRLPPECKIVHVLLYVTVPSGNLKNSPGVPIIKRIVLADQSAVSGFNIP